MTPLERFMVAIQFKEADRVPCVPLICGASRRIYGCNYEEWSRSADIAAGALLQAQELLGFDAILTEIDLNVEASDLGQETLFFPDDQACSNFQNSFISKPDDYVTKIKPVDPSKTERMSQHIRMCDILVNEKGESVPVFGFVYGPLGVLSVMRGPELLFLDCIKYPEEVQHALSIITHVLGDYIRALSKTGIHAIWMETLFGCHKQMSKKLWLETEGVHLKRLAEVIRECGLRLIAHSSGVDFYLDAHMETMAPDAISCAWLPDGFSAWPQVKQTCAEKVCIMGHVHPIECLYLGRAEEVREECKNQIGEMARGGGYVLAPGWEFPYDASLLNAKAMMDAAVLYGKYA